VNAGQPYDEKTFLSQLVEGDENAFKVLYERYRETIFRLVLKYLASEDLARDITQEILIKIWEKRESLKGVHNFQSYLLHTARNHAIDVLRAASRSDIAKGEIARQFYKDNTCFDDETLHRDYKSFIKRTVDSLPPRAKEVFLLCREEGKSYDEIAAALGISRNAVRNSMHLALHKFREAAREEFGMSWTLLLPLIECLRGSDHLRPH
jgi:RNA polymerase sigma-70 factor (ECF subfamily)